MPVPEELLKPIEGANPCGANLRYEPAYDEIKEARREQEGVPEWDIRPKPPDWPKVIDLASDMLASKSKDLQLAAWLTEAWLRRDGFGGLKDGLELLRGLTERFWDNLYPELEDGDAQFRAGPLQWVGDYLVDGVLAGPLNKVGHGFLEYKEARALGSETDAEGDSARQAARAAAIEEGKLTLEEFDRVFEETPKAWYKVLVANLAGSVESLRALEALGDERFGEAAPSYMKLRGALEDVQRVADGFLAQKLEADPDPPESTISADATTALGAAGGGVEGQPVEPTSAEDAATRIAAAAGYLQRLDPRNPASYLMLRGFRWGEIRATGSRLDPRQLAAPPTNVRTRLKGLLLDAKWAELLAASENVMATPFGRGWLDLQRYVLTACERLGSEYDHVAAAIRGALAALLRDVPQLLDLTLMDDTPTANAETREWLGAQALADLAPPAEVTEAPRGARHSMGVAAPALDLAFERALQEMREGRPQSGIELLMREVEREKTTRARFLRRAQVTGIMVDAGLESVALPILRELQEQIEGHRLEEWEAGEVVAKPMGLLYRCLTMLEGESADTQELYRRVCRLDPLLAMGFSGGQDQSQQSANSSAEAATEAPSGTDDTTLGP
jgi:type VI secretion system protein ImpA